MNNLTEKQKEVIRYAFLDLQGSLENPIDHDFRGQKETIKELLNTFDFLNDE